MIIISIIIIIIIICVCDKLLKLDTVLIRRDPWGYSGFQVTAMIEWQKSKSPGLSNKTQKLPGPEINPQKFQHPQNKFGCTSFAELLGRYTQALPRIFRLFLIPQTSLLS